MSSTPKFDFRQILTRQLKEASETAERELALETQQFIAADAEWFQKTDRQGPVYGLPLALIRSLEQPDGKHAAILSKIAAQRENRLTAFCGEAEAVGIWGEQFIRYPYLLTRDGFSQETSVVLGNEGHETSVTQLSEDTWTKLKGYAGWLMTDGRFMQERNELKTTWESLSVNQRPAFPFQPHSPLLDGMHILGKPLYEEGILRFRRCLSEFLRRWNLVEMTSWELPLPFGPYLWSDRETSFGPTAPLSVTVLLPVHYPLTATDGLLEQIKLAQRAVSEKHAPTADIAAIRHHNAFAQMFEVQHLERCIRSRCIPGRQLKGATSSMEAAIAVAMNLSVEQVKRHRKSISACLRGKRDSLSWLKGRKHS